MNFAVFSDLDGTLLDHQSYSFAAALPALTALKSARVPLILATSKTAAEVAKIHTELELGTTPAIVENGAGIYRANQSLPQDSDYDRLRSAIASLPQSLRQKFIGFGDVSAKDVSEWTGLDAESAALAKMRAYSEPGLWHGTKDQLKDFEAALAESGVHAKRGGRFLTLSFGRTKADAMREISTELGTDFSVALGDAPNDIEMLEAASIGIIVRNDHSQPLPKLTGEATGHVRRTSEPGPMGWNKAVLEILAERQKGEGKHT